MERYIVLYPLGYRVINNKKGFRLCKKDVGHLTPGLYYLIKDGKSIWSFTCPRWEFNNLELGKHINFV